MDKMGDKAAFDALQYLQFLPKGIVQDYVSSLKENLNTAGGTDNKLGYAILVPTSSGAQPAGTAAIPFVIQQQLNPAASYLGGSVSILSSNVTSTDATETTITSITYTTINTKAQYLMVEGGVEVNQAATTANTITLRLKIVGTSLNLISGTILMNTGGVNGKGRLAALLKQADGAQFRITAQGTATTNLSYLANKCFLQVTEYQ